MMKSLKKLVFASSLGLALALSGAAGTQSFAQEKKPPEPVKEREKRDDRRDNQKDRRDDNKKNDDRRGGDRKKP